MDRDLVDFSLDLAAKQADVYNLAKDDGSDEGMRVPLGKSGRDILYKKYTDDGTDMLGAELTAFIEAVNGSRSVAVTIEEATRALEIVL